MFRIVSDFVEDPTFLLLCDERTCGVFSTAPVATAEKLRGAADQFINSAKAAGWVLGVDIHLCPQHVAKLAQARQLIEVPKVRLT